MVRPLESVSTSDAGSRVSLDDQLASVVEQEGMTVLAADGVRMMRAPTHVDVAHPKRRRRKKIAYAERTAVSAPSEDRTRDAVADLDRVVVGFAHPKTPQLVRHPVSIRHEEHERSPYVVSLRGLAFAPAMVDERIPSIDLAGHLPPFLEERPNLEAMTSLASDLRVDAQDGTDQFTSTAFQTAYQTSYGFVNRTALALSAFFARMGGSAPADDVSNEGVPVKAVTVTGARSVFMLRTAVSVALLLFAATLPANAVRLARSLATDKAAALSAGTQAVEDARAATTVPLSQSADALRQASAGFRAADDALASANALAVGLVSLVPQTHSAYRTARALAEIGAKTSAAGGVLATGLQAALGSDGGSPLDRLQTLSAYAQGALPLLDDASDAFAKVDPSVLPEEERARVAVLETQLSEGRSAARAFTGAADLLGMLLGREEPRRYLVIFQNPSELRPTGGFMGSFAEVTVDRGDIAALNVPPGGTYALQGQLTAVVAPPAPLSLIADRWEFQDSNWSPDFPTAAQDIRYFWSKAGGPTVDGVIAVNATFVQQLLMLTGPIDIPEFGKTMTSENFMLELQKSVELEYDRIENQPKKILGLLAPKLLERLKALPKEQAVEAFGALSHALETKDIQVSLSAANEDEQARTYGWSGALQAAPGDALAVVNANIAGQKTDLSINENVQHEATISADGTILDAVTLTRTHTALKGELFRGVRNVSYIRFYVPRGATLVSAEGFTPPDSALFKTIREDASPNPGETAHPARHDAASGLDVWDEGDRTVFGGWSMVDPGQQVTLRVSYRLPFSVFDLRGRLQTGPGNDPPDAPARAAYSLLLSSQSGTPNRRITVHIRVPAEWTRIWGHQDTGLDAVWNLDMVSSALYETP